MEDFNEIIKKGICIPIIPESGGDSREVHTLIHNNNKYILRKCGSQKTRDKYLETYKKFQKFDFLPRLLYIHGNNLLFEYIQGRDLLKTDAELTASKIGMITAITNSFQGDIDININNKFYKAINYLFNQKIINDNQKNKAVKIFENNKPKKIEIITEIKDLAHHNFRIGREIFLVDIDAIQPHLKGIGIAKAFLKWFRKPKERELFLQGYNEINDSSFWTPQYQKFAYLIYLILKLEKWHKLSTRKEDFQKHLNWFHLLLDNQLK